MQNLQSLKSYASALLLPALFLREGDLLDVWSQDYEYQNVQAVYNVIINFLT